MLTYLFASAGPGTALFELLASSIGSGLVTGSFAGGLGSFIASRSRSDSEEKALIGGFVGGTLGLLALTIDIVEKHFV